MERDARRRKRARNVEVDSTRRFLEVFFGRFDAQGAQLSMRKPLPGWLGLSCGRRRGYPSFADWWTGTLLCRPSGVPKSPVNCRGPGYMYGICTLICAANLDNVALRNALHASTVYKCQTSQLMQMALLIGFKHRLKSLVIRCSLI